MTNALIGTGLLAKLAFRRDRVTTPAWISLLTATALGVADSSRGVYSTLAKRLDFAATINDNPAMLALYGPVRDAHSVGSVSLWKAGGIATALVAVMALIITVRHTRADEESGRLELVSAGVVGRYAALAASLVATLTSAAVLAVLVAAGLIVLGLPAAGSVAFALGWFAVGAMFAAVAAVTAQLSTSSRVATGLALTVLGVAYLLRAVGDAGGHDGPAWLTWASPLGWSAHLDPYAGERWWVLALPAAFTALCLVVAFTLVGRRDVGAGLVPDRPGPAGAAASLRGPLTLAWRLQRGPLLAWACGFAVYAAALGGVADSAGNLLGGRSGRDLLAKLGGHYGLADAFVNTGMSMMALVASAYAVLAVLRLRTEETRGLAEPVLVTRVGRNAWAAGHITVALAGSALLMGVAGVAMGLVHGLRAHDLGGQFPRVLGSALVQLPAVWVLAGIAVALFGLVPRFVTVAWGALGLFLLLGELGPLLKMKQWAMDASPYTHVPKLPGAPLSARPLVVLSTVAAAAAAAGLAGLRRRDIG